MAETSEAKSATQPPAADANAPAPTSKIIPAKEWAGGKLLPVQKGMSDLQLVDVSGLEPTENFPHLRTLDVPCLRGVGKMNAADCDLWRAALTSWEDVEEAAREEDWERHPPEDLWSGPGPKTESWLPELANLFARLEWTTSGDLPALRVTERSAKWYWMKQCAKTNPNGDPVRDAARAMQNGIEPGGLTFDQIRLWFREDSYASSAWEMVANTKKERVASRVCYFAAKKTEDKFRQGLRGDYKNAAIKLHYAQRALETGAGGTKSRLQAKAAQRKIAQLEKVDQMGHTTRSSSRSEQKRQERKLAAERAAAAEAPPTEEEIFEEEALAELNELDFNNLLNEMKMEMAGQTTNEVGQATNEESQPKQDPTKRSRSRGGKKKKR